MPGNQFRHCDGRHNIVTISKSASKILQRGGRGRAGVEPVERGATLQNFFPKKSPFNIREFYLTIFIFYLNILNLP